MFAALIFQAWWLFIGPGQELFNNIRDQLISRNPSWPTALADYDIQEISPQFQELWMIPDAYILADSGWECNLLAFHGKLFFEASFEQNEPLSLNHANLETGEIVWQTILDPDGPNVMTHNADAVFFGSGIPGNIIAYDIESGSQIWERSLSWQEKNIISYMQATEDNLYVNSSSVNFQVFDTHTGKLQEWDSRLDAFPVFYVDGDVIYHREIDTRILAVDRITGRKIWEARFDEPVRMTPVFTEGLIIVKTGKSGMGQIYAIDRSVGTILWQYPPGTIDWRNPSNIIGNVTEDNEYVFYLTLDAQLQAVNAKTGRVVGRVQFTPTLQELDDLDRTNGEFCIAASDNVVVIYLGTGRQLFAFRFLPDE